MRLKTNKGLRIGAVLFAQGVLIYGHFLGHNIITIGAFIGSLLVFLILSHRSVHLTKEEKTEKVKAKLNQKNADRKSGKWVTFKERGDKFVDLSHPFSNDLNLFGEDSLFQYLSDANTEYGKEILKQLFITNKRDENSVLRRQEAIKEVSENRDFCQTLKITGMLSKNISSDPGEMVRFFESKESLFKKVSTSIGIRLLPVFIAIFMILNFNAGWNNALVIFTGLAIIVQVMVFVSCTTKTEKVLKELSKFGQSLDDFGEMVDLIKDTPFRAELNQIWQRKLPKKWSLKKMTWALSIRNVTLLDLLLNVLFLWDIQCVCALEKMRKKEAKNMGDWLECIGYFEAMASVANLSNLNPEWATPKFHQELIIHTEGLGHPLIEEVDRVTNDFELKGIAIISGSNMSGKTTFLRTIGINLVLAYMGAPVCATKFSAPVVDLWTCMKPPDNLKQNISTFYAELLRIKEIIESEKSMLFLIDEIFAGTNSEDRIEGAKEVLLNLSKKQNLGLVTTHDLEVCKRTGFENYHFNESYMGEGIHFDYKIKPGISTTRNARHLMRMVGIYP